MSKYDLNGVKVYPSGPMSERYALNYPSFWKTKELILARWPLAIFIDPTRHPNGLSDEHYYELGEIDAKNADLIVLLPDWHQSRGVRRELSAHLHRNLNRLSTEEMYGTPCIKSEVVTVASLFESKTCPICEGMGKFEFIGDYHECYCRRAA